MLGEDDLLIPGLVCVATSFLRIVGVLLVAVSFMLSIRSSTQPEKGYFRRTLVPLEKFEDTFVRNKVECNSAFCSAE